MRKLVAIFLLPLLIFSLCSCSSSESKKPVMPDFTGCSLRDALADLKELGFTDVEYKPDKSSAHSFIFDIDNWVVVDQRPVPVSEMRHSDDIILFCVKYDEQDGIGKEATTQSGTAESQLASLANAPLSEAVSIFATTGYTPNYLHSVTKMDFNGEVASMNEDYMAQWVVTGIENINNSEKTADVYIDTYENINRLSAEKDQRAALEKKLSPDAAMTAIEYYGEDAYPYGFKLHWIAQSYAEEAEDENTWFFKVGCEIKNAYGTWLKELTCEAKVSGTTDNPKVISFNVY